MSGELPADVKRRLEAIRETLDWLLIAKDFATREYGDEEPNIDSKVKLAQALVKYEQYKVKLLGGEGEEIDELSPAVRKMIAVRLEGITSPEINEHDERVAQKVRQEAMWMKRAIDYEKSREYERNPHVDTSSLRAHLVDFQRQRAEQENLSEAKFKEWAKDLVQYLTTHFTGRMRLENMLMVWEEYKKERVERDG
jgi:hypothetical protein